MVSLHVFSDLSVAAANERARVLRANDNAGLAHLSVN